MKINKMPLIIFIVLFTVNFRIYSQDQYGISQTRYLFEDSKPLNLTLNTDLLNLINNRKEDQPEQDVLILLKNDTVQQDFKAKITTRGNFRRDSVNCDFPPLRIIFESKSIENTFFEGNNKIKIVTHCKSDFPVFEQYILREYLIYRIYNLLTPNSFKVRLAKITYVDQKNRDNTLTKPAFLIEDIDHLAERNGMEEYEGKITFKDLEKENAIRLSLFQYMIGNTDWIVGLSKNLKFISDGSRFIAVPYDFDYTALAGTDYSLGNSHPLLSPPDRKFKGGCFESQDLFRIINEFEDKRRDIYKLIRRQKGLDYTSRQHMLIYLREFFHLIKSRSRVQQEFRTGCG